MATTLAVIIGNRGFFPAILARDGREEILRTLEQQGYKSVRKTSSRPSRARIAGKKPRLPIMTPRVVAMGKNLLEVV